MEQEDGEVVEALEFAVVKSAAIPSDDDDDDDDSIYSSPADPVKQLFASKHDQCLDVQQAFESLLPNVAEAELHQGDFRNTKVTEEVEDDTDSDFAFSDDEPVSDATALMPKGRNLDAALDSDGEDDAPIKGRASVKTKHEIDAPVVEPVDCEVPPDAPLTAVGTIVSHVDSQVVVESFTDGEFSVLDAGTVMLLEDRTAVGRIFETFGPVSKPLYSILFPSSEEAHKCALGTKIFYVEPLATFVFTQQLKMIKGSDASNLYDEEVSEGELEFSDDEKEAEFRRERKSRHKEARSTDPMIGDRDTEKVDEQSNQQRRNSSGAINGSRGGGRGGRGDRSGGRGRGRPRAVPNRREGHDGVYTPPNQQVPHSLPPPGIGTYGVYNHETTPSLHPPHLVDDAINHLAHSLPNIDIAAISNQVREQQEMQQRQLMLLHQQQQQQLLMTLQAIAAGGSGGPSSHNHHSSSHQDYMSQGFANNNSGMSFGPVTQGGSMESAYGSSQSPSSGPFPQHSVQPSYHSYQPNSSHQQHYNPTHPQQHVQSLNSQRRIHALPPRPNPYPNFRKTK